MVVKVNEEHVAYRLDRSRYQFGLIRVGSRTVFIKGDPKQLAATVP